jgi:hypothetical protein
MNASTRSGQLQIRVTPAEKAAIQIAARRAGLDMSAYVLGRILPGHSAQWQAQLRELARCGETRTAIAALSAWLAGLSATEMAAAVATPPPADLSDFHANYVAAMVEHLCAANGVDAPRWTRSIRPLAQPVFGTQLASLRLHLLAHSPPPFRRRNLFVDTAVGGQV